MDSQMMETEHSQVEGGCFEMWYTCTRYEFCEPNSHKVCWHDVGSDGAFCGFGCYEIDC